MKNVEFLFEVDDITILARAGILDGREEIYLNGRSISTCRNFKLKSTHDFEVDGKPFSVCFLITRIMFGQAKCQLLLSGQVINSRTVRVNYRTAKFLLYAFFMLVSFFALGIAKVSLGLPGYVDILAYLLILVLAVFGITFADWSTIVDDDV